MAGDRGEQHREVHVPSAQKTGSIILSGQGSSPALLHELRGSEKNAVALAQFMKRSGVHPKTPVELHTVDDIYITTDVEPIWSGKLGEFDPKSLG